MTNEQGVVALMSEANPVPDLEQIDIAQEATQFLVTLEQRSSEMTQLKTKHVERPSGGGARWLAIAAAAVILLGFAVVFLTRSNEEPPVATPQPVTTVVVPTTEPEATLDPLLEEAMVVATAFSEASAAGDVETLQSLSLQDGHTLSILGLVGVEQAEREIAWRDAVGWSIEVSECELTHADVSDTNLTCHATHNNALGMALGVGPYWGRQHLEVLYSGDTKLGTEITKTTVSFGLTIEFAYTEFRNQVGDPFLAWLRANHLADVEIMLDFESPESQGPRFGNAIPNLSEESIELWRQHVAEFVAEQSG